MSVNYTPTKFTLLGRKQIKKAYNSAETGFQLDFFIIGEGGVDEYGTPKEPLDTATRLECEGVKASNIITFTNNSNTAITNNISGLSVGDYIRPDFSYNDLKTIGYIKWYRIQSIEPVLGGSGVYQITLNRTYTETTITQSICKNTADLYGFVKAINPSDLSYPDDYTLKVRIYLSTSEGNGYTGSPVGYSENGLYDAENNLIGYSNFAKISKNDTIELIRYFEFGF